MPSQLQHRQSESEADNGAVVQDAWLQAFGSNQDRIARLTQSAGNDEKEEKPLHQQRGELARKQGRLSYEAGQELHGKDTWETQGRNRGPLITPMKEANHATGQDSYEWCGMFVGHAYQKAGIRKEILSSLVFWSGYRLHLFFTKGEDVSGRKIGNFWQPHTMLYLNMKDDAQRKAALDDFGPQPGDIVLFRSDYSHVGMVDTYDSATGQLEILEGNSGNRVQATTHDSGDEKITFIGRFNDSDYGKDVDPDLQKEATPEIEHNDWRNGQTSWAPSDSLFI